MLASYPHELSGGMAQRVNIALALAGRPQLLIADEPTTALDVTVQAEILQLLRELQHATGMAILIITHDWGVVADVADRAVVMYAGEVVEQADVHTLFRAPRFPYTAALLAADPSTAPEGSRLPTLPGRVPPPGPGRPAAASPAAARTPATAALTGPIPLMPVHSGSVTRCLRVDDLVARRSSAAVTDDPRSQSSTSATSASASAVAGVHPCSGRSTTSASRCTAAAPWGWSASPALASRRSPEPCSVWSRFSPAPSSCSAGTSRT